MSVLFIVIVIGLDSCAVGQKFKRAGLDSNSFEVPPTFWFFRIYGDNDERNPPILLIQNKNNSNKYISNTGFNKLTLEFDVDSDLPPNLEIKFVHCDVNWKETDNAIIQNNIFNRSSSVEWTSSTFLDDYYSFRGKLTIPSPTVKFEYSGNYKAKIYSADDAGQVLAEQRFFVIMPQANTQMRIFSSFYDSQYQVTNSGLTLETIVWSEEPFFDNRMHSVVYYRNNRFYEPYVCSNDASVNKYSYLYNFDLISMISGFSTYEKRFRIEGIPTENVYRVLYMSNTALFPRTKDPVRLPMMDIARNGNYYERDNDGVMRTDFIGNSIDDYVLVEFVLDPGLSLPDKDVFVAGSFNNWKADRTWMMNYDQERRLYRVVNWVRRGTHDYLYGVGSYNADTDGFEGFSYDYFEGNTIYANHSIIGFVYYRQVDSGEYDSIIGVVHSKAF
ncbi:MAG TPA: DUF5103 domain-containing protein [Candidatus Kapabacteria bacterium]|nr:DUF5103 domain-containing protein [Candidatus Kapabacteria bacterium]